MEYLFECPSGSQWNILNIDSECPSGLQYFGGFKIFSLAFIHEIRQIYGVQNPHDIHVLCIHSLYDTHLNLASLSESPCVYCPPALHKNNLLSLLLNFI